MVPHITDAIQDWIEEVAKVPVDGKEGCPDVCVIELGGTVGDIESSPFVEALRQVFCPVTAACHHKQCFFKCGIALHMNALRVEMPCPKHQCTYVTTSTAVAGQPRHLGVLTAASRGSTEHGSTAYCTLGEQQAYLLRVKDVINML